MMLVMSAFRPESEMEKSPWICHVCDFKSAETESQVCALCFRVTCAMHLWQASVYNQANGLYETAKVCIVCGSSKTGIN